MLNLPLLLSSLAECLGPVVSPIRLDLPIELDQILTGASLHRLLLKARISGDPLSRQTGQSADIHIGYRAAQDSLGALLGVLLLLVPLGRGDLETLERPAQSLRRRGSERIAVAAAVSVRGAGRVGRG